MSEDGGSKACGRTCTETRFEHSPRYSLPSTEKPYEVAKALGLATVLPPAVVNAGTVLVAFWAKTDVDRNIAAAKAKRAMPEMRERTEII